jgi:hypothetical protein
MIRKSRPGHYLTFLRNLDARESIDSTLRISGAAGFEKRYTWRGLEPDQGIYNFDEIASDLHYANCNGKTLIVNIEDKTFQSEMPVPQYLAHLCPANTAQGFTVARWHPLVVERYCALLDALGRYFDGHVAFEGVSTVESALTLGPEALSKFGYTPTAYRDSFVDTIRHAADAMPSTRYFWRMNFLPGNYSGSYLSEVVSACLPAGNLVLGGPDALPDNEELKKRAYWLFERHKGDVPAFMHVSPDCFNTPGLTAEKVLAFSAETLHCDYVLWTHFPWGKSFTFADACAAMTTPID